MMKKHAISLWLRLCAVALLMLSASAFVCENGVIDEINLRNDEEVVIESNSNPDNFYANNANCVWDIILADGVEGIELEFTRFDLEAGYDFLRIVDNDNVQISQLSGFFGRVGFPPLPQISTITSRLTLTFTSDLSVRFDGFSLKARVIEPGVGTVTVISPSSTSFVAPGTIQRVQWTATGNPGQTVKVSLYKCIGLSIDNCRNCGSDGELSSELVKVLATGVRINGEYEWDVGDNDLEADTNYVIEIRSEPFGICGRSYFFQPFDSPCSGGHDLVTDMGEFRNPEEQPGFYTPGEECFWRISADQGKIATVNFRSFDTAPGDKLYAFNGFDSTAPPVPGWENGWSGQRLPPSIESTGNYLFFQFLSAIGEIELEHTGWIADYSTGLIGDGEYYIDPLPASLYHAQRIYLSWTFTGTPGPDTYVQLWRTGGTESLQTVTESTPTGLGFTEFTIPATLSTLPADNNYFFVVGSTAKPSTKGSSNGWTLLQTSFKFLAPTADSEVNAGEALFVSWTVSGAQVLCYQLDLSITVGTAAAPVTRKEPLPSINDVVSGNAYLQELIPGSILYGRNTRQEYVTDNGKFWGQVKIEATAAVPQFDGSGNYFCDFNQSLPGSPFASDPILVPFGSVEILSPPPNVEILQDVYPGTNVVVRWASKGAAGPNLNLEYCVGTTCSYVLDPEGGANLVIPNLAPFSVPWRVLAELIPGTIVTLRLHSDPGDITDYDSFDPVSVDVIVGNAKIEVYTPNAQSILTSNTFFRITWAVVEGDAGSTSAVELYKCGDVPNDYILVEVISVASSNTFGYQDWLVEGLVPGQRYAVKVSGEHVRFSIFPGTGQEQDFMFYPALFGQRVNPASDYESDIVKAEPYDGCAQLTNNPDSVRGKIVMIQRGGSLSDGSTCYFTTKVQNAQNAGAIAVVVVNTANTLFLMGAPGNGEDYSALIPSIAVTSSTGVAVEQALGLGNPNVVPAIIGTAGFGQYNYGFGECFTIDEGRIVVRDIAEVSDFDIILTESTTLFLEWENIGSVDPEVSVFLVVDRPNGLEQLLTKTPIFNNGHFDWLVGENAIFEEGVQYYLAVVGTRIDEGGTQRGVSQSFRIGFGECLGEYVLNCPSWVGDGPAPEDYECSGVIADGSGEGNLYNNNKDCKWLIVAPPGYSVSLSFTQFDTELTYDYVELFSGGEVDYANLLTRLSGTLEDIQNDPKKCGTNVWCSQTNEMLVRFFSDVIITGFGFEATFEVVQIGTITLQGPLAPDSIGDPLLYFEAGDTVEILWTATGQSAIAPVSINLLLNFELVEVLAEFDEPITTPEQPGGCLPPQGCSQVVTIPADVFGASNYLIEVMDRRYPQASAITKAFTIRSGTIDIVRPVGGAQLFTGEEFRISWRRPGATGKVVDISLRREGRLIRNIALGVANDDNYVLGLLGDNYYYPLSPPSSIVILNGASPINGYITAIEMKMDNSPNLPPDNLLGWELRIYAESPKVVGQESEFTLIKKQRLDVSSCVGLPVDVDRCRIILPRDQHPEIERGQYVGIANTNGALPFVASVVDEVANELHGFWTFGYSPGQEVPSDVLETRSDYTYGGPYFSLGLTVDVSWSDTELESSFLWKVEDSNVLGDDYQIEVRSSDHAAGEELDDVSEKFAIVPTVNFMIQSGVSVVASSTATESNSATILYDGRTDGPVWKSNTFRAAEFKAQTIEVTFPTIQTIDEVAIWWAYHQDAAMYNVYAKIENIDEYELVLEFQEQPCVNSRIDRLSFFDNPIRSRSLMFELVIPCYTGDDENSFYALNQFGIFEIEVRGCPENEGDTCPDLSVIEAGKETCFDPVTQKSCSGLTQGSQCECTCNFPTSPIDGDALRTCGICSAFWSGTELECGDTPPQDPSTWVVDTFMILQGIDQAGFTAKEVAYARSIVEVVGKSGNLNINNITVTSVRDVITREPGDKAGIEVESTVRVSNEGQAKFVASQITTAIKNSGLEGDDSGVNLRDTFEAQGLGKDILVDTTRSFAAVRQIGAPPTAGPTPPPDRDTGEDSDENNDDLLIGLVTFFAIAAVAGLVAGIFLYKKNAAQQAQLEVFTSTEMRNYKSSGTSSARAISSGPPAAPPVVTPPPPDTSDTRSAEGSSSSSTRKPADDSGYGQMVDDEDNAAAPAQKKSVLQSPFSKKKEEKPKKKGLADMADQSDGGSAADTFIDIDIIEGAKGKEKKKKGKDNLDSEYFQQLHDEL